MDHRQQTLWMLPLRKASLWPVLLGLAWLVCGAVDVLAADDDPEPRLRLGEPHTEGERVYLDCTLSGLIAGEVLDALQSGLPTTLVFEWQLWWDRDGLWDKREATGLTYYRIYYDVLQNRYDIFDRRGRLHATAEDPAGTENCFGAESAMELPSIPPLSSENFYYLDMTVRIEPLDEEEIRNLEDWLRGDSDNKSSLGLVSTLSNHAVNWLKGFVVPEGASAKARTKRFKGWVLPSSMTDE